MQRWALELVTRTQVALESHFYRLQTWLRLDLKWLQTWLDSRKRTREYFKSNSSLLSLNTYITDIQKADCIRTPASNRTASCNSSTILSEQRVKTAERITLQALRVVYSKYLSALYPLVFLSKAKRDLFKPFQLHALSLSIFGHVPARMTWLF